MGFSLTLFQTVEMLGHQSEILGMISTIIFAVSDYVRIFGPFGFSALSGIMLLVC